MSLRVDPSWWHALAVGLPRAMNDLADVCPDPRLAVTVGGNVVYAPPDPRGDPGEQIVAALCALPCDVVLGPLPPDAHATGSVLPLGGTFETAAVWIDGRRQVTRAVVYYHDGWGAQTGVSAKIPLHVAVFALLAIAQDAIEGTSLAPEREEAYRAARGVVARRGAEFWVDTGEVMGAYSLGGCHCFVATAAYGSPLAAEVQSLRSFRDEVLRGTRAGAAFFDRFWPHYYRLSPPIVAAMEGDPEARELIRHALVAPIVEYLRIARTFPEEPLDGVPEPWRSFAEDVRERLASWGAALGLPDGFDGVPPDAALDELRLVLRYVLRRPADRRAYLDALRAGRKLPIAATARARARFLEGETAPRLERDELDWIFGTGRAAPAPHEGGGR